MPLGLAPFSDTDHRVMGYRDSVAFFEQVQTLAPERQRFVVNITHRLADVEWLTRTLDDQVCRGRGAVITEGLLSLQFYLLLTCADTLGHVCSAKHGVKERFRVFFETLPQEVRLRLTGHFLVWATDWEELVRLGLADPNTQTAVYPSREQINQQVECLSIKERLDAVMDFFYFVRRNPYTHETEYPQLGWHPNLSVLQMQRLGVPNVGSMGELDRIQATPDDNRWYFVYYNCDDPIAELRWAILRGLGEIVRLEQQRDWI